MTSSKLTSNNLPPPEPFLVLKAKWMLQEQYPKSDKLPPCALPGTWGNHTTDAQDRQNAVHSAHRLGLIRRLQAQAPSRRLELAKAPDAA